jgi:hypothetical protein
MDTIIVSVLVVLALLRAPVLLAVVDVESNVLVVGVGKLGDDSIHVVSFVPLYMEQ